MAARTNVRSDCGAGMNPDAKNPHLQIAVLPLTDIGLAHWRGSRGCRCGSNDVRRRGGEAHHRQMPGRTGRTLMGSQQVDQVGTDGSVVQGPDAKIRPAERLAIVARYLPEVYVQQFGTEHVLMTQDSSALLVRQVHHLGHPWPGFKKRIQIPNQWISIHRMLRDSGVRPLFIGLYRYQDVTIFVDFDPTTYIRRKANNSAAHVATNDLFQAQMQGSFTRVDRNGNRLTSVRADRFAEYLGTGRVTVEPHLQILSAFNSEFLDGATTPALEAVRRMHAARWPDRFQGEWPGFFLEYRLHRFLTERGHTEQMTYLKQKRPGAYDYDVEFRADGAVVHYGDLKASDHTSKESPGNDAAQIQACVQQYGRFWYVIYEHHTWRARDNGDEATIAWNHFRRRAGHQPAGGFNELSYARRFKEAVRFFRMRVLEVNTANFHTVLGDFAQGRQPSGQARALKVMIRKDRIDNFLVHSHEADPLPEPE